MKTKPLIFIMIIVAIFMQLSAYADSNLPPLHQAIEKHEFQKADKILSSDPDQVNFTIPMNADFVSRTQFLVNKTKKYINEKSGVQIQPDLINYTTLELAIINRAPLDLISKIVSLGQDINLKSLVIVADNDFGRGSGHNQAYLRVRTPLLEAIESNHTEIIQYLVDNGADLEHVLWEGSYFQHVFNVSFGGNWKNFDQVTQSLMD